MNPAELIGSLNFLGLNKSEAARFLGVTYRTVHRWTEGEQEIPRAVAIALRLMIRFNVSPNDI
jgi:plasmid maintenance system antidote protein VapI